MSVDLNDSIEYHTEHTLEAARKVLSQEDPEEAQVKSGHSQMLVYRTEPVLVQQPFGFSLSVVEDSPRGFPYVASYLDSEDTFAVFRRFGWVHTRLLLNKQDELRALESDLRAIDKMDGDNVSSSKYLQSRTKDNARQLPPGRTSRQQLLDTLEKKTLEYGTFNNPVAYHDTSI